MSSHTVYPFTYRAFSLNIASSFPVTAFDPMPVSVPDVTITEGEVPGKLEDPINTGVLYQANAHEFLLHLEQVARYLARNGNEIIAAAGRQQNLE
jgi:hypothetical protein